MPSRSKQHHIVPINLQKHFAITGDKNRIFRSKKNNLSACFGAIKPKEHKNVFVIPNYNTILINGKPSDVIERKFYGELDDFLGWWVPEIKRIIDAGKIPSLDIQNRRNLCAWLFRHMRRTPEFAPELIGEFIGKPGGDLMDFGRYILELSLDLANEVQDLIAVARITRKLQKTEEVRQTAYDAMTRSRLIEDGGIIDKMSDLSAHWAVSNTKASFALTSNLTFRTGNGGMNGLNNPLFELWFPITPKISLVLCRGKDHLPAILDTPPEMIRRINIYQVKNSFEIASGSEALLSSLIKASGCSNFSA